MKVCFLQANEEQAKTDQGGVLCPFVWSLNTNEVREVATMVNFNLNKTQSLNDTLRVVYMEEGGIRGPWGRGPKPTLTLVSPHKRTLKIAYTQVFRNYMSLAQ